MTTECTYAIDNNIRRWGEPGLMVEDDYAVWPAMMDRLLSILRDEAIGSLLFFEAEKAINDLYAENYEKLTCMGAGYFHGFADCYRGKR